MAPVSRRRRQGGPPRRAWIYAGNPRGRGEVNLASASVRRSIANEAHWLVQACGFDGVQWDYEICEDGDPGFLRLLRETRAAFRVGAVREPPLLPAAVPIWVPAPFRRWG